MSNVKDTTVTDTLPIARKPDVHPALKEHFEKFCRKHGIPKENILDLTKTGKLAISGLLFLNVHNVDVRNPR